LVHSEVSPEDFKRKGGPMEILQLWVNLPARLKMTAPRYIGLQCDAIPAIAAADGVTVHLIAGEFLGQKGPVPSLTGVFMTTVEAKAGGRIRFDGLTDRDVFLYVVRGAVTIAGKSAPDWHLVELSGGDAVDIEATKDSILLFGHAAPIAEPVVAYGPFVMNTEDEIRQAYADYHAGKFGVPAA